MIAACVFQPGLVLQVRDARRGDLLFAFPVKRGEPFFLRYTHSTAKTQVEEHFLIAEADDIVLTRMIYSSAGAGIPDMPPPGGSFKIGSDGRFVMDGLNHRFKSLHNIRVAYFYPFLLKIKDKRFDLTENARGRLVDITVSHRGSMPEDDSGGGSCK
ncbi:MAG: DUF1850 domain-containing protein [Deltaproteobacteria bacterium]|nr:DUF1850 domain-containing protein [Deltaproteobacteria bacterium]